jgi:hypothetical protein
MKHFYFFIVLVAIVCCVGCGANVAIVKGTVKYNDGSPVTAGYVVFENSTQLFRGKIQSDGTYITNGLEGETKGIPFGVYKVYIDGHIGTKNDGTMIKPPTEIYNVAKKHRSSATSGLSFEIKSGGRFIYNIDDIEKP